MKFENVEGKTVTYSIDHPVEPANSVDVNTAMEQVIAQNAFTSSGGDLVAKKSARIVERVVEEIDLDV